VAQVVERTNVLRDPGRFQRRSKLLSKDVLAVHGAALGVTEDELA
jgi:hypothetical protein